MDLQPSDEAPPIRPFNWTWALIVAVWLLLFMIVLAVGAAVVFWRQATSAKIAVAGITAEYQTLNDQLTASEAKAVTLTKDRSTLVDQLTATNKQLAAAGNQLNAPNAGVAKLTSERNAIADQLANTNANLAKLTTERDTLAQKLAALQPGPIAAANPAAPVPPPVVANPPNLPIPPAPMRHKRSGMQPVIPAANPPPTAPAANADSDRLALEYSTLQAKDPNPSALEEVTKQFEQSPHSKGRVYYGAALMEARAHRSLALVPLLLKYFLTEPPDTPHATNIFAETLTILTGEEADLNAPLAWWLKNKATLTTDFNKMTDAQRRRAADVLLRLGRENIGLSGNSNNGEAFDANSRFRGIMSSIKENDHKGRGDFYCLGDLSPALVPLFLETAGWVKDTNPLAPSDITTVPLEIVPMLATLHHEGGAPDLAKIAADTRQCGAARLACLLALHAAGENISGDTLLSIATDEKHLTIRIMSITAMEYTPSRNVAAKLIDYLGDPNDEIVAAAAWALQTNPTPDAVPALKAILERPGVKSPLFPAINALGKIKSFASADALADFMATHAQNANDGDDHNTFDAYHAFCEVTNYRRRAGPEQMQWVIDAVAWWNAEKAKAKH